MVMMRIYMLLDLPRTRNDIHEDSMSAFIIETLQNRKVR